MSLKKLSLIFFLCAIASLIAPHSYSKSNSQNGKTVIVWICTSENSYAYHYTENCQGLKRCKVEKKQVTLADAQGKYERKLCGFEK